MKRAILLIFLASQFLGVQAKAYRKILEARKDSNYIETFYKDLIIRLYSGEKTHSIELNDRNLPYKLRYQPNGYFNLGTGIYFRSFGVSLATKVPLFIDSEMRHGETKRFGIQSYMYSGRFAVDVLASFLDGYYLNKSFNHLANYDKGIDYQRPDISSVNLGLSVNYIFNYSRFSYRAAFSDTERQKKSAGSLIAGGSFFSYQTEADSSFVPRGIDQRYFLKSRDISQSGVLAFNANLGYAYSLIFLKNGIFTVSYILGSGVQENSIGRELTNGVNRWRYSLNHSGRLGVGYRFNRYYTRISVIRSNQYTSLKYNDLSIWNGTNFLQFSIGKRISFTGKRNRSSN